MRAAPFKEWAARISASKFAGVAAGPRSSSSKPLVKTASCLAPHTQYHVSGRLHVLMDDGTENEFGPGDFSTIPPGHDAWVVGNEPVVVVDFQGMIELAQSAPFTSWERRGG